MIYPPYHENGRELVVRYTCKRCGKQHVLPYDIAVHENASYLSQTRLPNGWQEVGHLQLICCKCAESFKEFMNPTKTEE